jgi:hypothetical protein
MAWEPEGRKAHLYWLALAAIGDPGEGDAPDLQEDGVRDQGDEGEGHGRNLLPGDAAQEQAHRPRRQPRQRGTHRHCAHLAGYVAAKCTDEG